MVVHDLIYDPPPLAFTHDCRYDEYEVKVKMSSNLFSGTDDKVEIRLYGRKNELTDWLELSKPFHNGLERLSEDIYCIKTDKQFKNLNKIGIRKFGTDDMMIEWIMIHLRISGSLSGAVFSTRKWIERDENEYIFESKYSFY